MENGKWEWGSSRHTFAPIDSTFCTPAIYMLVGALGGPTMVIHVG